jgi:hypothetical protein
MRDDAGIENYREKQDSGIQFRLKNREFKQQELPVLINCKTSGNCRASCSFSSGDECILLLPWGLTGKNNANLTIKILFLPNH